MDIEVKLLDEGKLQAEFDDTVRVITQNLADPNTPKTLPDPFDLFASSLALCATYYIKKFCEMRNISIDGLKVFQKNDRSDPTGKNPYQQKFILDVILPENFPEKYKPAVLKAVNSCTVKKVIENNPDFEIKLT